MSAEAPFPDYELPPEKEAVLRRARRVEWWTIFFLLTIIAVVGLVVGMSQTMKAMWVEDTLSLVPPAAFLVGVYYRRKPPDEQFSFMFYNTYEEGDVLAAALEKIVQSAG